MDTSVVEIFHRYWNANEVATNLVVFANIFGALLLGLMVGYERFYHGRAAGMRTYGIVCMASCALTVFAGYPQFWYGGQAMGAQVLADPTRVVQGIVTGVGFLGAGVIMKDGFNISGLTTAASLWASSAIGVLTGVGFYMAAILLTALSAGVMMWAVKLEKRLPTRPAIAMVLRFRPDFTPVMETLMRVAQERGYQLAPGSLGIRMVGGRMEWRYVAVDMENGKAIGLDTLASELATFDGVQEFEISHARN
jgi:putative Mg2+ transporter-C (MgtC) family protein